MCWVRRLWVDFPQGEGWGEETSGRGNGERKLRDRMGKARFKDRWSIMGDESGRKSQSRDVKQGSLQEPEQ